MFPGKHLEHTGSISSRSKAYNTEMSLVPFVLAFLEKSERELTLDSSDLRVPSTRRWWSMDTAAARFRMKPTILDRALPRSFRNVETVFFERGTPGYSSDRKLLS